MSERPTAPAKTREVFEFLKKCAKDMRTVTYGEIAEEAGLAPPGTGRPLGYIRDAICIGRGLPWLNVIGVRTDTRRPADPFLPEGVNVKVGEELVWRGMVLQVFAHEWSGVEFD